MNWSFFGAMVIGCFLSQNAHIFGVDRVFDEELVIKDVGDVVLAVADIFIFNLVLSGFMVITLSGLAFFALPIAFLLFRGLLWGMALNRLQTPLFFAALPTLIIEGEGYVLVALAGVKLGLSWLKPELAFKGRCLTRSNAVKIALKECARVYALVAILLLVAAVIEVLTLMLVRWEVH